VRAICSKLIDVALTSTSRADRDDCLFCLELVTGRPKLITATIAQNTRIFQRRSRELRSELDVLSGKSARLVRKVFELRASHTADTRPAGPLLLPVPPQLEDEIALLAERREFVARERRREKKNRARRDELKSECAALSADALVRSAEIRAAADMQQERLRLQLRADELR
jgi:hypothetical protein